MNEIAIKKLRDLDLKQQLLFCEAYLPDAWEFLHDIGKIKKPVFNDDDEVISWGVTPPQDTPQDADAKEEQS
jgi:hypothetical protein